jgi:hypothetical protein
MSTGIEPHQATGNQFLHDRRQFRLASIRTVAPDLELKALCEAGQVEKDIFSSRRM